MKLMKIAHAFLFCFLSVGMCGCFSNNIETDPGADGLFNDGNFAEAYVAFTNIVFSDGEKVTDDDRVDALFKAEACLRRVGRQSETEPLTDNVMSSSRSFSLRLACIKIRKHTSLRALWTGDRDSMENCRTSCLKDLESLMPLLSAQNKRSQRRFWGEMAGTIGMNGRLHDCALRLQELTDLTSESESDSGGYDVYETGFAPVDRDGNPVFYKNIKDWKAAENDGERWMYANFARAAVDERGRRESLRSLICFARSQFGTENLVENRFMRGSRYLYAVNPKGTQCKKLRDDLMTLGDDETLTRLANGVKRFKLPKEYDYMGMWRELNDYESIADEYERRYQLGKAVEAYRKAGLGRVVERMTTPTVRISGTPAITRTERGRVCIAYRNFNGRLDFSIAKINPEKEFECLVSRIKKERISNVHEWLLDPADMVGAIEDDLDEILEDRRNWSVDIVSEQDHFKKTMEVKVPFDLEDGDYLVEMSYNGMKPLCSVLRVMSLMVVKGRFDVDRGGEIYVVDAVTGAPVSNAAVTAYVWDEKTFEEHIVKTDANALAVIPGLSGRCKSLQDRKAGRGGFIRAATKDGRNAFSGIDRFHSSWHYGEISDDQRSLGVIITDRPVYRPGDTVKYRFWKMNKRDGKHSGFRRGAAKVVVESLDGRGEIYSKTFNLDAYGGAAGEIHLSSDVGLGKYRFEVQTTNGCRLIESGFRVEEYRKPEFSVSIEGPRDRKMLGEKVSVKVKAGYLWGGRVVNGKADIIVRRSSRDMALYAPFGWAWLYGNDALSRFYDADWYDGPGNLSVTRRDGVFCCIWQPSAPPETLIRMKDVPFDENGEISVTWDTSFDRKLYGDVDQCYHVAVSVTDNSRRTIDASSVVNVRSRPFGVLTVLDRQRYRVGDVISVKYDVEGLAEDGVKEVRYRLYTVDGRSLGEVEKDFVVREKGQYRISVEVSDVNGRTAEGSRVFIVADDADECREYRYSALELISDKAVYAPGDTVRLTVNTDHPDSTVFVRVKDAKTVAVRLKGKTGEIGIPVTASDRPNFFVEAWTVSKGRYFTETREIMIPPVDKIGKAVIEIDDAKGRVFAPGDIVTAIVRIFDEKGDPIDASGVISVYDKAVDLIAGGSNVGSLAKIFWGWKNGFTGYFESVHVPFSGTFLRNDDSFIVRLWKYLFCSDRDLYSGADRYGEPYIATCTKSVGAFSVSSSDKGMPDVLSFDDFADARTFTHVYAFGGEPLSASGRAAVFSAETCARYGISETPAGVRKDFADAVYWNAALESTGTQGVYRVRFRMPDDLTAWNVKVWTMGADGRVSESATEIKTKKDLVLRMAAPRFFTQSDEVVLSSVVHNYGGKTLDVTASVSFEGVDVKGDLADRRVTLPPGGEITIERRVKIASSGRLKVSMRAAAGALSDGVEKEFDVVSRAIRKTESFFKRLPAGEKVPAGVYEGEAALKFCRRFGFCVSDDAPAGKLQAFVAVSDTLAGVIDSSLDYLKYFEYECAEQTMNRFVPAVLARDVLEERGFGGRLHDIDALVARCIKKLRETQRFDGGWCWFPVEDKSPSWQDMTVTVVRGLGEARRAGVDIPERMLRRGCAFLEKLLKESLAHMNKHDWRPDALDVMTAYAVLLAKKDCPRCVSRMLGRAYDARSGLPVYAQAVLGLALDLCGDVKRRDMVVRNLKQYVKRDAENATACLDFGDSSYWGHWYAGDIEVQALALKLFAAAEPASDVTEGLALYLANNRKNRTHWFNTRDTGLAVEALAEYCRKIGNSGSVYVNAYLTYNTREARIKPAGLELKVNRTVSRVVESDVTSAGRGASGRIVRQKRMKETLRPLARGERVNVGDILEVRLDIDSKNDYEYILVEDGKGAGFEPLDGESGWKHISRGYAYVEFKEKKTALFLGRVPRGNTSFTYRMRVETPGSIHILPAKIEAMYVPRLSGNSSEIRLDIGP